MSARCSTDTLVCAPPLLSKTDETRRERGAGSESYEGRESGARTTPRLLSETVSVSCRSGGPTSGGVKGSSSHLCRSRYVNRLRRIIATRLDSDHPQRELS